ncbi:hypothetical protein CLAIMM_07608 [Cladophialophora immunda]|nr:hypothetical protein CLAIMM_07608 [Cladophialophora immunda]
MVGGIPCRHRGSNPWTTPLSVQIQLLKYGEERAHFSYDCYGRQSDLVCDNYGPFCGGWWATELSCQHADDEPRIPPPATSFHFCDSLFTYWTIFLSILFPCWPGFCEENKISPVPGSQDSVTPTSPKTTTLEESPHRSGSKDSHVSSLIEHIDLLRSRNRTRADGVRR